MKQSPHQSFVGGIKNGDIVFLHVKMVAGIDEINAALQVVVNPLSEIKTLTLAHFFDQIKFSCSYNASASAVQSENEVGGTSLVTAGESKTQQDNSP